jgi:hypothetical protein
MLFIAPAYYANYIEKKARKLTIPKGPVRFRTGAMVFIFFTMCYLIAVGLVLAHAKQENAVIPALIFTVFMTACIAILFLPLSKIYMTIDDETVFYSGGIGPRAVIPRKSIQSVNIGRLWVLEIRATDRSEIVQIPFVFKNNALLLAMLKKGR